MLKVGSMFSGIGGICLAFKQAGAEIIWANDIDKHACITYRENFGADYLVEGDIRSIDVSSIPDIDILTAGFPCQAFSIAGYKKGFDDERGNLFFEVVRVLKGKHPKAFLLENVKNLVSHDNKRTFSIILNSLESAGYKVKFKVMNTKDYTDIPQNRERVFIVGFSNLDNFNRFEFPEPLNNVLSILDIIDITKKVPDKYYYTKQSYVENLYSTIKEVGVIYSFRRNVLRKNKNNVCPALIANMGTGGNSVPLIRDNFGIRKLTPRECLTFQGFPQEFKIPEGMADSHIYRQIGNSVTVSLVRRIAENMIKALYIKDKPS